MDQPLSEAYKTVWLGSSPDENFSSRPLVRGPETFNDFQKIEDLIASFSSMGLQASKLSEAADIVKQMLDWKFEGVEAGEARPGYEQRPRTGCTIFLSYTSNLMSSGLREVFRLIVQHNLVDCLVTTAGGIEEDFIKCMEPFRVGDFALDGEALRRQGVNRIGNMLVTNVAYCKFQDWLVPLLDTMMKEKSRWTPSQLIDRLGEEINDPSSVYYWAHKNKIPVFCPALTDGSLGDILYFHSYRSPPGLCVDIVADQRALNNLAVYANRTGMIILGGGVSKHQVCNANLMRNGAELAIYVNTGLELDGSDSGASPDEAKSWGKIKTGDSRSVKVFCDASIAFPLIVGASFVPLIGRRLLCSKDDPREL